MYFLLVFVVLGLNLVIDINKWIFMSKVCKIFSSFMLNDVINEICFMFFILICELMVYGNSECCDGGIIICVM